VVRPRGERARTVTYRHLSVRLAEVARPGLTVTGRVASRAVRHRCGDRPEHRCISVRITH